jgi:trimethylamine--corrinoid protein Co-methyltransferase
MLSRSNYQTNASLIFRVFTEEQCQELHSAALEILESVGVEMHSERALVVAKKAGAYVEGKRVKFPAALVEKCIRSAPSRVVLCDRDGNRKMMLEGNRFYFGPGPTATHTIDPFTGERKVPGYDDTCRASRVMDALPNIDYQMDFGTIGDVEPKILDVYTFEAMLKNSTKPIVHWAYNTKNLQAMIDMAAEVAGGIQNLQSNPFFAIYTEPVSPLVHEFDALDNAMLMAENNLPAIYTPAPQAGVTAPATLAGTIVVSLCESLSGLVIHQTVKEGAPFIMGGVITIMDMATTQITYGSPEFMLMAAGLSEMAHYYKIPMFSTAGCSDAKTCDGQHAVEISQNILMAALSGGNLIHDVGYIESGMCTSLQSLVIADEVIGQVKRLIRGIEVNENTLALDIISEVGPGGTFIAEEHTFNNFKKEWFFPTLFNRRRFMDWEAAGKPTLADNAQKKLLEIIENHQPKKLDEKIEAKLKVIVESLL